MDKKEKQLPGELFPDALMLLEKVWNESAGQSSAISENGPQTDPVGRAMNHAAGHVVQSLLTMALREKHKNVEGASGLDGRLRELLEEVVACREERGKYGRSMMALFLAEFTYLDADWAKKHVWPLFDWDADADQAARSWNAHGEYGRVFVEVLDPLLVLYRRDIGRWGSLRKEAARGLVRKTLCLMIWGRLSAADAACVLGDVVDRGNDFVVTRLAEQIDSILQELNDDDRRQNWNTWILPHLKARIANQTKAVSAEELQEIVGWAPKVPDVPEYVNALLTVRGKMAGDVSLSLHGFANSDMVEKCPVKSAQFMQWMLKVFKNAPQSMYSFEQAAQRLANLDKPPREILDLLDAMCDKGSRIALDLSKAVKAKGVLKR